MYIVKNINIMFKFSFINMSGQAMYGGQTEQ